jgi:peptidoglycan/xylan/chitin deacetylase (PgdA/CDA1 family)
MKSQERVSLDRGVFTLSLDFELIWGTLDLFGPERFRRACEIEREVIIDRLLALLAEFDIRATWCALGHLMLEGCAAENGLKHPEIVRPSHAWFKRDWFEHDPCAGESGDSIFVARSLIEKIQRCPVEQEIGCHSFSHVIFGDRGCSRETAESEVAACVDAAKKMGIRMRSFAFPRNQIGHLDVIRDHGFACYRGVEPSWHEKRNLPEKIKRAARLFEVLAMSEPPVSLPERDELGLWNIPGSMIYFPMHGLRRHLPSRWRVRRAIKGLNAAAHQKRVFHLWFHPTNLADETDAMFEGLRKIFEHASSLRERDELMILPMRALSPAETLP